MATKDEFGIVYNNDFGAWYIVYRLKDDKQFQIDSKIDVIENVHGNNSIDDAIINRIKYVAQLGYEFNPYITLNWCDNVDWF